VVRSLALMLVGTSIVIDYLQVSPWWGWISHDTTLASGDGGPPPFLEALRTPPIACIDTDGVEPAMSSPVEP
jgi:hypothetical protein